MTRLGRFSGTDPESGKTYTDEEDLSVVPDDGTRPDVVVTGAAAPWTRGCGGAATTPGSPWPATRASTHGSARS